MTLVVVVVCYYYYSVYEYTLARNSCSMVNVYHQFWIKKKNQQENKKKKNDKLFNEILKAFGILYLSALINGI